MPKLDIYNIINFINDLDEIELSMLETIIKTKCDNNQKSIKTKSEKNHTNHLDKEKTNISNSETFFPKATSSGSIIRMQYEFSDLEAFINDLTEKQLKMAKLMIKHIKKHQKYCQSTHPKFNPYDPICILRTNDSFNPNYEGGFSQITEKPKQKTLKI